MKKENLFLSYFLALKITGQENGFQNDLIGQNFGSQNDLQNVNLALKLT